MIAHRHLDTLPKVASHVRIPYDAGYSSYLLAARFAPLVQRERASPTIARMSHVLSDPTTAGRDAGVAEALYVYTWAELSPPQALHIEFRGIPHDAPFDQRRVSRCLKITTSSNLQLVGQEIDLLSHDLHSDILTKNFEAVAKNDSVVGFDYSRSRALPHDEDHPCLFGHLNHWEANVTHVR